MVFYRRTVPTLLTGFLTMLTLIVAIGAQNAFVLRTGLARHHVGAVVVVCALSDAVRLLAGVLGVGSVVSTHPTLPWPSLLLGRHRLGAGCSPPCSR